MNKHFYKGPKIEIGKDYIRIKKRNIRLSYQEIKSIRIKKTRIDRAWLFYILTGFAGLSIILFLFYIFIQGLFNDTAILARSGLFYRKRIIVLLMFFFIGGPFFIIIKIKKYFKKDLMLVINWEHHDFRIKISDIGIDVYKLKMFFEGKLESLEFEIPNQIGKT